MSEPVRDKGGRANRTGRARAVEAVARAVIAGSGWVAIVILTAIAVFLAVNAWPASSCSSRAMARRSFSCTSTSRRESA